MSSRLKDKITVIIGGGSWIGKEIAKTFAFEGTEAGLLTESTADNPSALQWDLFPQNIHSGSPL